MMDSEALKTLLCHIFCTFILLPPLHIRRSLVRSQMVSLNFSLT